MGSNSCEQGPYTIQRMTVSCTKDLETFAFVAPVSNLAICVTRIEGRQFLPTVDSEEE